MIIYINRKELKYHVLPDKIDGFDFKNNAIMELLYKNYKGENEL